MELKKIDTCIIPAAGKGTRWAPVSGYLPKEMLPLIDKPVIEWVINEAIDSGCKKIIIVINKHKEIIRDYLLNERKLLKKASFNFVYQDEALGISQALFLCKDLLKNEPVTMALPDLPTIAKTPVLKQLIREFEKKDGNSHIISFDKFNPETLHLYGECLLETRNETTLEVAHFCPKSDESNRPHHFGTTLRMSGRFVFTSQIFPIIEKLLKKNNEEEISDRTALQEALENNQSVVGLEISGHTYDTGFPTGYVRANTAFFKKKSLKKGLF